MIKLSYAALGPDRDCDGSGLRGGGTVVGWSWTSVDGIGAATISEAAHSPRTSDNRHAKKPF
jgi:hypothetical protein